MNTYDPMKNGAIIAVRIYEDNSSLFPKAEFAFAFGGTETIDWANTEQRESYMKGVNAYTFVFDERKKREFKDYVK